MTERAAHLGDRVLRRAPVRQWVLSLPFELRYRLAWDHRVCRAVLAVYTRALLGFYRKRARASADRDGRTGAVTVIQRFGDALNLNVHFHTLAVVGLSNEDPGDSASPRSFERDLRLPVLADVLVPVAVVRLVPEAR